MAGHTIVEIPASNVKERITEILYDQGYIHKYIVEKPEGAPQGVIKIAIKYDRESRRPVIRELIRVSRPGLRSYVKNDEIPRVINGLGIAIVSTSRGVLTDKQARDLGVGGEVLCYVY